jgi:L-ascorbate metabolism protein UlaG (beta-lactamase superfamily)
MNSNEIKFVSNPELEFVKSDYKGNIVIDGIYCNGLTKDKPPTWKVVKWKLSSNPQKKEKKRETFALKVVVDNSFKTNENDVIIWLGHSSFYIRLNGTTYLIDPITSDLPTSKRKVANPYDMNELGKIDYILISHVHYDHFDVSTLEKVVNLNPEVAILGPLGISTLLNGKKFASIKRQEAGWFQTFKTDNNTITFLPARHWSRRGLLDFNKVLWGGFAISSNTFKIYFAGDTARETDFFAAINEVYKGFDVCMIPIGSYSPRFLMEEEHVNPQEALELFQMVNGKYFIPIHYGTYDLSDEPLGEPVRLLKENAQKIGVVDKILDISVGKPLYTDNILNK